MYKYVKKLAATALPLCLSVLLSACGGAPADEPSNNPSSVINKPQVSSAEASSAPSSVASSTTSANTSSIAKSSTDSYSRMSRASSSHSSSADETDSTPPGTTKLLLYRLSENSITLIWDDAIDNVGISHYEIERNEQLIATLQYPIDTLADYQLLAYTDYRYTITAFDAAGNQSEKSPVFFVRTLAHANSSIPTSSSSKSSVSSSSSSAAQSSKSSAAQSSKSSAAQSSSSSAAQSSKSSAAQSSKSSAAQSSRSASSVSSSTASQKSAKLTWSHPIKRENGQYLELDEIGGYEIRYRKTTDNRFTYIVINSNQTTEYTHADASDTEFEIAAFDTNGVYSRFVKVAQ